MSFNLSTNPTVRMYDFEVTPNWWLCVYGDTPTGSYDDSIKENFGIIRSDNGNARDELVNMLRQDNQVSAGYNIKHYDLIIANAIYQGFTPQQIFVLSDLIIFPDHQYMDTMHLEMSRFVKKKFPGIVYMDLYDDNDGTLKDKESTLGLDIRESTVPFTKENLTEDDKLDMIKYCKHDVYSAMKYYTIVVKPAQAAKFSICKKFNIPIENAFMCTNANLVCKALGAKRTQFSDENKLEIFLPAKIKEYCYEVVPSDVLERLRTTNEKFTVNLFGNKVSYGNGGIHSVYENNIYVESNDEWMLANIDATSYYPSMLIQFNCISRALEEPKRFVDIFNERVYLKHLPNPTQEQKDWQLADKLILNTTFGASGNKWLDIYDPYMCTRCCRLGQIFLTALAMRLVRIPGLKIIQTNTDGILAYFRRKDKDRVLALQKQWSEASGIGMDLDLVDKIWQRDVNNYLLIKEGGKIKRKGLWLLDRWDKPGYFLVSPLTAYVCAKAVINWLARGEDIVKTILSDKDVFDFAITCKKGGSYKGAIQRYSNGMEVELFNSNRVVATKDKNKGMIYKYKETPNGRSYTVMANIPEHCLLVNDDFKNYNFNELSKEIDYSYYLQRCADLMDIDWLTFDHDQLIKDDRWDYFKI